MPIYMSGYVLVGSESKKTIAIMPDLAVSETEHSDPSTNPLEKYGMLVMLWCLER